jgi:hypothetical protein
MFSKDGIKMELREPTTTDLSLLFIWFWK